jgi:MFS family permease
MIIVAELAVPAALAVVAWATAGLGMGLSYAPLSIVVLAEAPAGAEGTATAALQLCDTLGVALGTGVSGAIVAAGATFDWTRATALTIAFALCATVAVITAIAAFRLPGIGERRAPLRVEGAPL